MLPERRRNTVQRGENRFRRADGLRRIRLLFVLFSILLFGVIEAAQLENPANNQFNANPTAGTDSNVRTALFADRDIPNHSKSKKSRIRQVSGEVSSVWDSPAPAVTQNGSFADWDGPALVAPSNGNNSSPTITSPAFTPSTPSSDGLQYGFGPPPTSPYGAQPNVPQPQFTNPFGGSGGDANPAVDPNAYFSAMQGLQGECSNPFGMPSPNGQQGFQQGLPMNPNTGTVGPSGYTGMGYYDPSTGNVYGNPYALGGAGMNSPYVNAFQFQQQMQQIQQMQWLQQQMQMMGQQEYPPFQGYGEQRRNRKPLKEEEDEPEEKEDDKESGWSLKRLMPVKVSSPLFETCCACFKTLSPFSTPTGSDRGVGQPLMMRNWQDRPYYFGGFCGWICGSQLVDNLINQDSGATGGLKLGYYFSDYWGVESRLHFASISISETGYGKQIYDDWFYSNFPDESYIPLTTRSNHLFSVDVSVQYYPFGNAKWRPYFSYGLGFTRERFSNAFGREYKINAMCMPVGLGFRYWWNERLAIQFDVIDNVVFANGIAKTQNNFAFTVGISYAFGSSKKCRPTSYWPYTPSTGSKY